MAVLNLAITIPDDQVARMRAALRTHWGQVEDPVGQSPPVYRDLTNNELTEKLRTSLVSSIKDIVKRVEADAAKAAAEATIVPVDAT